MVAAPAAIHTHRWLCGEPVEGVTRGVCSCGAERTFLDPDARPQGGPVGINIRPRRGRAWRDHKAHA